MDSSENIDLHAEPASRPKRLAARWLAASIGGLPALATVLAFGGAWSWQLDLLAHFRVQYAAVLAIMVILAMFMRSWRLSLLLMVPLTINIAVILPLYFQPRWLAPHPEFISQDQHLGTPLKIMSYNMGGMFEPGQEPLELIRNSDADVVVLQDVRPAMLDQLEFAVAPFRVFLSDARTDGYGVAMLLRVSIRPQVVIEDAKLIHLTDSGNDKSPFAIEAKMRWQGRLISVLTLRAATPLARHNPPTQAQQFQGIVQWVSKQHRPVVVIGDLNTTPWSYAFKQLLDETGLQNSQLGFGVQGSWPATGGAIGQLPIDHCLVSPSLLTINRKLGPSYQSTHHAMIVTLQWAGGAKDQLRPLQSEFDDYYEPDPARHQWRRFRDGHHRRDLPEPDLANQLEDNSKPEAQAAPPGPANAQPAKPVVKPEAKPVTPPPTPAP